MAKVYPDLFSPFMQEQIPRKNNMLSSGIVQIISSHPQLTQSGEFFTMPIQKHMENIGDIERVTTTTTLTLNALDDFSEQVVVCHGGKAVKEEILNDILRGAEGLRQVAPQITEYWSNQYQDYVVSAIKGATDSDSAAREYDATGVGDGSLDLAAVNKGRELLGETGAELNALIVHSSVLYKLASDGPGIDYTVPETFGETVLTTGTIPVFNGMQVVVNDTLCAPTGSTYPSYLVSREAQPFWLGFQRSLRMLEDTNILLGGGQNQVAMYSDFAPHVKGFTFDVASIKNPTKAQLETSTNWTKVGETENIKYVRVLSLA